MYLTIAVSALWIAVVVQGILLFGLYYTHHRLLGVAMADRSGAAGLLPGAEIPGLLVVDARTGDSRSMVDVFGEFQSLIFVSASCGICRDVVHPTLGSPVMRNAAVYCDGDREDCGAWLANSVAPLFIRHEDDAVAAFELTSLPSIVRVGEDGKVAASVYPVTASGLEDALRRWAS